MKAAIYARFSSDRQTDKSIDDQVALCRALCAREGLDVVAVYDDRALSGASTLNRMGLQRMLRDARAGRFEVVVAEALDRISRDQEDLAGIHKRLSFAGIVIHTAQDGVAGDLHIGVKGLMGQMYHKDLAQKTHRGQAGVARDGRHNGGRAFGYRAVPGRAGELSIDEAEAVIVRRIFADYLAGASPREIAARLNAEKRPGPRGGVWNASTIAGSRKRLNGVLQNELYAGSIVWNRQRFVKDPDTGRRISRLNPRAEWMTADAPQLRIVDAETWRAVQARRARRGGEQTRRLATRPQNLLSGLVRCGCCGSGFVVGGVGVKGKVLRCSRMRETGLCDNRTSVVMTEVEDRVLAAIERDLVDPAVLTEYVREYHKALAELARSATGRRTQLQDRLSKVAREIGRTVDAIVQAGISRALQDRLGALEAERDAIETELAELTAPPLAFHPRAAEELTARVGNLRALLAAAEPEARVEAFAAIRQIVDHIVVHPTERKKPANLEVHGQLATLLRLSEPAAETAGVVVAGIGFEPMTFRL